MYTLKWSQGFGNNDWFISFKELRDFFFRDYFYLRIKNLIFV